jgi:ParB-like chromosome segregation protein Spo0J
VPTAIPFAGDGRIEVLPVHQITPYSNNARTHSKKQIRQIAESIRRFGFTNPVLVDDNGQIIAGHGRVEAAKLIGLATLPAVRLSHLSAAEKRAYILADNRLAEKAGQLWARQCRGPVTSGPLDRIACFAAARSMPPAIRP